jgi:hypothetical protein
MAGGRRLPPSIERIWLGELRRAHAIINIIKYTHEAGLHHSGMMTVSVCSGAGPRLTVCWHRLHHWEYGRPFPGPDVFIDIYTHKAGLHARRPRARAEPSRGQAGELPIGMSPPCTPRLAVRFACNIQHTQSTPDDPDVVESREGTSLSTARQP